MSYRIMNNDRDIKRLNKRVSSLEIIVKVMTKKLIANGILDIDTDYQNYSYCFENEGLCDAFMNINTNTWHSETDMIRIFGNDTVMLIKSLGV